jgi:hypothetical protein
LTSGSGIRCLFDPWIRDPGWVKNQNPESGALLTPGDLGWFKKFRLRIRYPDPVSGSEMNNLDQISKSFRNNFLGLKYLNSLMLIRDLRWKKFGTGIRDKTSRIRNTAFLVVYKLQYSAVFRVWTRIRPNP